MAWLWRWQAAGNSWGGGGFDRLAGLDASITMWTMVPGGAGEDTVVVVPANEAVPNPLLRQAREARNLTQDEVAEGLVQLGAKGVTGGLVSSGSGGSAAPTGSTAGCCASSLTPPQRR
jgi:hypothetical protein